MSTSGRRRTFLKMGAGLAAAAPFAPLFSGASAAQTGDGELLALQRARRIRLARGIVLTLDRRIGDFVSADVVIEDGKISAIGQNIPSPPDTVVVDCVNRIIIPGFVDTERPRRPRLQSRHPEQSDAQVLALRRSHRRADHCARHDRHGYDHHRRYRADQPLA